jgi:CRISPR-associated protein Csx10
MIEAGAVFEGTIRNVPLEGREVLARALELPLSIGRGRGAGGGRVQVKVLKPPSLPALDARAKAFDQGLRQRLEQAGLSVGRVGRLVPVTLLSPLLSGSSGGDGAARDGEGDGAELLREALGAASCFLSARRFVREGGWNQRRGGLLAELAVAAGSVFVFDLGEGRDWRQELPRLEQLEREGLGRRRHQGFGRVLFFDPFFLERSAGGK